MENVKIKRARSVDRPKGATFVRTTQLPDNFYWTYHSTKKDAAEGINQIGETHWHK